MLLAWDLDAVTTLPLIPQTSVFLKSLSRPENVAPTPLSFQMGVTAWFLIAKEVASMIGVFPNAGKSIYQFSSLQHVHLIKKKREIIQRLKIANLKIHEVTDGGF